MFSQAVLMVEGLHVMRRNWSLAFYSVFRVSGCLYNRIYPVQKSLGDLCGGGTPGPIPNPEAKPASADGTWGTRPWESRSSPRDLCLRMVAHRKLRRPAVSIVLAAFLFVEDAMFK